MLLNWPLLMNKLGGKHMKYNKPEVRKIKLTIKVNTNASERSSCEGGHCVKARYGQDH